ncbi:DUF2493 domain-containing protein [Streptomyces hydrogenans]|uniref:DUF2493 domain-containing protein n=1 Tax=Streptomyces hydrogenans TaxID=1873719 RepID=UPI0035D68F59
MTDPFRILVTGSRDWTDRATLYGALNMYASADELQQPITVIHGDCATGADAMAETWALTRRVAVIRHPAKWREHGVYNPQAGLARNRLMVELGADVCLAFIKNGSRGASHCARLAEEAGIPTRRYVA